MEWKTVNNIEGGKKDFRGKSEIMQDHNFLMAG